VPGAAKEEWRAGWLGPGEGGPGLILILLVVMRPVGCPHCLAWLLMEVCRLGMGVWKVGEQACQETNDMWEAWGGSWQNQCGMGMQEWWRYTEVQQRNCSSWESKNNQQCTRCTASLWGLWTRLHSLTAVASGSASIIYSDTIATHNFVDELTNYQKYSGVGLFKNINIF